jgi:hypothetical protein
VKRPRIIGQTDGEASSSQSESTESEDDRPEARADQVCSLADVRREGFRVVRCEVFPARESRPDDHLLCFRDRSSLLAFLVEVRKCPSSWLALRELLEDETSSALLRRMTVRTNLDQLVRQFERGLIRVGLTIEKIPEPIGPSASSEASSSSRAPAPPVPEPLPEPAPSPVQRAPWKPSSPAPPPPPPSESTFPPSTHLPAQVATLLQVARTGVPFCEECEKARQKASATTA